MNLQNLILTPPVDGFNRPAMYYRGRAIEDKTTRSLLIKKGDKVDFQTFFNAFQLKTWKKCDAIKELYLKLFGEGELIINFTLQKFGQAEYSYNNNTVKLSHQGIKIPISFYKDLHDGLLSFNISAVTDIQLTSGAFATDDPAPNKVKLGMCITHFNRQKFVIHAAQKLSKEILEEPEYQEISLIIVDNSQNLKQSDIGDKTILVPNRNTGGSGGFTRGLLTLKDQGFTHCLFMDDDASCESEGVKRVYAFYSYYDGNEHIGISGILLQNLYPNVVHEAGGYFKKGRAYAINAGLNIEDPYCLGLLDHLNCRPNYGAWCFFAFRIADIKHLAFPFFVRGDDILFSQHNELSVMTMMGVSTWIDSFLNKDGITTRYLSFRSDCALALILKQGTCHTIYRNFKSENRGTLFRLQYAQSRGIYKALYDLMTRGSKLFSEDPEGSDFRSELKQIYNEEKYTPLDERKNISYVMPNLNKKRGLHSLIRHLTLNGLLLPKFMFKHRVFWNKSVYVSLKAIYRFKEIFYYNDEQNTYCIAKHDKLKIVGGLLRNYQALWLILKNFKRVQQDFEQNSDYLTSETYWRKTLGMSEKNGKD